MLNASSKVYLGSDSSIRRQIFVGRTVADADSISIFKVALVLKRGSIRYEFDSDQHSISLPDQNWNIDFAIGTEDIQPGNYDAHIKLFDSFADDGLVVNKFTLKVLDV